MAKYLSDLDDIPGFVFLVILLFFLAPMPWVVVLPDSPEKFRFR